MGPILFKIFLNIFFFVEKSNVSTFLDSNILFMPTKNEQVAAVEEIMQELWIGSGNTLSQHIERNLINLNDKPNKISYDR